MARLRRADCTKPGISRRRRGASFSYTWHDGTRVTEPDVIDRITGLVLPPAWTDVWICPWPNGHIQAIGTDAAGRRQYRYHDEWRIARDREKHARVLTFAERLPAARDAVRADLSESKMTRSKALACAFRLLDLGFFRIGSEEYAEENGTFGLATIRREHVSIDGDAVVFEYIAKHHKERVQSIVDDDVRAIVTELLERDDPENPELLAYRADDGDGMWVDVKSADINSYVRDVTGAGVTAKDFRTWHATVLMAVGLAASVQTATSPTARKRAVSRAVTEVSTYLGNTPAVCRRSYIDPRIIDMYEDGVTIEDALESIGDDATFGQPATHGHIEAAVLQLLQQPADAKNRKPSAGRRRTGAAMRSAKAA